MNQLSLIGHSCGQRASLTLAATVKTCGTQDQDTYRSEGT
ncbi:hypothetical protein QF017_001043 [Pseudomonas laurylsulfatiphila]